MSYIDPSRIKDLLPHLTQQERVELAEAMKSAEGIWSPLPGPQMIANERAKHVDVLGYGGAAGGGKTDLAIGLALTDHTRTAFFRREGTELTAVIDRIEALLGNKNGYNGSNRIWRLDGRRQIEFGSCPNPGDERKYQGRPRDLLVCDETTHFLESQVRYLMGWVRTENPNQHCLTLLPFNPPESDEALWVIDFFAPWLDDTYPVPAEFGEVRWFAHIDGVDTEVVDGTPFEHVDKHGRHETLIPQSRTFVLSRVTDNPYYMGTGYEAQLQALPEEMRERLLYANFKQAMVDKPLQVIPTEWVEQAQARWREKDIKPRMDSMGVDVARGGKDNTTIARRHGNWFDRPVIYPGKQTPDGPTTAGIVISHMRDKSPIHIDVIGVGTSPYDFLVNANQHVLGINMSEKAPSPDRTGRLMFHNMRSWLWWKMREALDPLYNEGIALPPDPQLKRELCAPCWRLKGKTVYVESRDEIIDRIGVSPDVATAYILALMNTPRREDLPGVKEHDQANRRRGHDPYDKRVLQRGWNPYGGGR